MLRFYYTEFNNSSVIINDNSLLMDNKIWQNCKSFLHKFVLQHDLIIELTPIKNKNGELITYGYQDNEANRELRMLRELKENEQALQFTDIFPEYKEVLIWGCNELAVSFAEYLSELGITVSVMGQYWDLFGYESCDQKNLLGGGNRLTVYAEGIPLQNYDLSQTVIRSVSPEFECIDKIYEANVLKGRIQDTVGDFDEFIHRLRDDAEIVILGEDREAQDTYDLLMAHGIDICCFAVPEDSDRMLLGRQVMNIEDAMKRFKNPVFLNCKDIHGALGEEWTEYFDYCGYERNKQYFLVQDYTEIPTSNLVHVLHEKKVLLTGDSALCRLLSEYLNLIENGEVTVQYIALSEKVLEAKDAILCLVIPDYQNRRKEVGIERKEKLKQQLINMNFRNYTEYFICCRSFVLIDRYLNHCQEKYTVPELLPKGIIIGKIPPYSGNVFFRGIMDGVPEVLLITYSDLNENLFYYCVRLANIASDQILSQFWAMYDEEAGTKAQYFPLPEKFEARVKSMLILKDNFTSQELFVLFHIAYAEMLGCKISDISDLVIYWEPHFLSRNEFPYFALWLEDEKVEGHTIVLRRNNIVRAGSVCARNAKLTHFYETMFLDVLEYNVESLQFKYWKEYKMRFEDIKVRPREKLTEICKQFDIVWSDVMLHTTTLGETRSYRGSADFDLKAVFNKYEDYLSCFDRFRISIASSPYQKKYGFSYENCLNFSRRELQEMFLKPFLYEKNRYNHGDVHTQIYEWLRWQLWNVRKHMLLDDVCPEFDRFDLEQPAGQRLLEHNQNEIDRSIEYVRNHDKLILYGTGNDCLGLLKLMDESTKERLLYSDKKAETKPYIFQSKNVIAPKELCSVYKAYNILVTSSLYRRNIEYEFENMGIDPSRIHYSRAVFREADK